MPIDEVEGFRKAYAKFLKWLSYMAKRRLKIDARSNLWKKIVIDFNIKVVDPLEKTWNKLTNEEKRLFGPADSRKKQTFQNIPF